jgi:hypothetical protein
MVTSWEKVTYETKSTEVDQWWQCLPMWYTIDQKHNVNSMSRKLQGGGGRPWVCSHDTWKLASFTQQYTKPSSPPPYAYSPNQAHGEESGSPYDTEVIYKCNGTPPKTKKPNFALPISGTAKLNLWNAIPSVNMRQACRGTKSELKIKHGANEYKCILHVVEECKIRLWHY